MGVLVAVALSAAAGGPESFGEGVTDLEPTPIAELVADPESYVDRTVRVEGAVGAVCERKGCWMLLSDAGAEVRVKVPDDVIVFPAAAVGRRGTAQGVVRVHEMDRSAWITWQRHLAEERGEPYDETAVGPGPFLRVEIAGTGAEIDMAARAD